ncbi:MAG TPA: oligosaccharide flippase family protein [Dyella sp.]|uniref:oligosaccharide flippase family protein n=1 Tax=Dyella sp. TaxID=1869338 RepID=UPI002D79F5FA|nr:oligosaccharide flippase family protein [Dyella sp.]HET6554399.1 oligosaccharide flippase family protein [Dyella sp.]
MSAAGATNRRLDVLRSVTIVSVSSYIEFALGLFVSVWIARALGPADFGRYAFTVWLCGLLILFSNHALTTSSTKFIAEADGMGERSTALHVAWRLNRMQHASSAVVIGLFLLVLLVVRPVEWHDGQLVAAALVVLATVSKANYAMWVAIAKGQERFETEAIATVLVGVLSVAMVIAATLAKAGLLAFVGIFAACCLLLNLINRWAYRRYCQPFTPGPVPAALTLRLNRHLRLTAVLIIVASVKAGAIEVFLLNSFANSAAVGFFAIAQTLTKGAVQLFSVGLTTTLLPYMAKTFGERGHEHAVRFLGEASRFYWAVGLVIAGLGLVTTPDLVTLMYGHRYTAAIPAIEAMLVLAGLLLIGNGIAAYQTVVDRQGDRIRVTIASLFINLAAGIALVPAYGLLGAVLSYAITRLSELVLAVYYLRKATTGGLPVAAMARLLGVGIVATLAAWMVTSTVPSLWGFIPSGLVFVGIFVPASVLVRYWGEDDFRLLAAIAQRFGPPGRLLLRGLHSLQGQRADTLS